MPNVFHFFDDPRNLILNLPPLSAGKRHNKRKVEDLVLYEVQSIKDMHVTVSALLCKYTLFAFNLEFQRVTVGSGYFIKSTTSRETDQLTLRVYLYTVSDLVVVHIHI